MSRNQRKALAYIELRTSLEERSTRNSTIYKITIDRHKECLLQFITVACRSRSDFEYKTSSRCCLRIRRRWSRTCHRPRPHLPVNYRHLPHHRFRCDVSTAVSRVLNTNTRKQYEYIKQQITLDGSSRVCILNLEVHVPLRLVCTNKIKYIRYVINYALLI